MQKATISHGTKHSHHEWFTFKSHIFVSIESALFHLERSMKDKQVKLFFPFPATCKHNYGN